MTPVTSPRASRIGTHKIALVRKLFAASKLRLKRASSYASRMLTTWPVWATAPAMPDPSGTRISPVAPWAMRLHSSFFSRSRMNSVHRSASTTRAASLRMSGSSVSMSRCAVMAFATSRIELSLSTRRRATCSGDRDGSVVGGEEELTAPKPSPRRHLTGALFCFLCFASGCGASMILHVKGVTLDEHLRVWLGGGGNSSVFLHGKTAFVVDVKFGDWALKLRDGAERDLWR